MKRKITLSIDSDIYEALDNLPRKVSVSEMVNWVLRGMLEDLKMLMKEGREMSAKETRDFIARTVEGKDFLDRVDEHLAPKYDKMVKEIREIQEKLGIKKRKQK